MARPGHRRRRITKTRRRRRMGPGAITTPAAISGLSAWYDFSNITTLFQDTARTTPISADAQVILGVADGSGAARHLQVAVNGPAYKASIQNSRSVARFDGSNDNLVYTVGVAVSQPCTSFVVVNQTKPGANAYNAGGGANLAQGMTSSGFWTMFADTGFITGAVDRSAAFHSVTNVMSGASSAIYNDGNSEATGNPGTTGYAISVALGSHTGAGSFGTGDIGEYIVYNTALSAGDRNLVVAYLRTKWNLP